MFILENNIGVSSPKCAFDFKKMKIGRCQRKRALVSIYTENKNFNSANVWVWGQTA